MLSCKVIKLLSFFLCFCFISQQSGIAQVIGQPVISSSVTAFSNPLASGIFRPLHLRYLSYDTFTDNFKVFLDKGSLSNAETKQAQATAKELLKYFFIGLALPNKSFWVNLRPDAEDNIIDDQLARTDIGKILLEADLQLKKDTARFTSPNTPEGKKYWSKLYQKAEELFGSQNVEIPTFTRPWIVPGEIILRETVGQSTAIPSAYIYKATLKVMLEQDYLRGSAGYKFSDPRLKAINEYSSQLVRELILPKLNKEINTSQRYASLRQVYYSLILAQWFKARNYGKKGFYSRLIDKNDLTNLTSQDNWSKSVYFQEYRKSFKNGEYNIQESVNTPYGQTIRSYCSGGMNLSIEAIPWGWSGVSISSIPAWGLSPAFPEGGYIFDLKGMDGGIRMQSEGDNPQKWPREIGAIMTDEYFTPERSEEFQRLNKRMLLEATRSTHIEKIEFEGDNCLVTTEKGESKFLWKEKYYIEGSVIEGWTIMVMDPESGNRWSVSSGSEEVTYRPGDKRFPQTIPVIRSMTDLFRDAFSPEEFKKYIKLRDEMLLQACPGSTKLIHVGELESGYRVQTNMGTFIILAIGGYSSKGKNVEGWGETIYDEAGNSWSIGNGHDGVKFKSNKGASAQPERFMLNDSGYGEWTRMELPSQAKLIDRQIANNNYPPAVVTDMRTLQNNVTSGGMIPRLLGDTKGGDAAYWDSVGWDMFVPPLAKKWTANVSQTRGIAYFYRLFLEVIDYWQTKIDPYKKDKDEDLAKALQGLPLFMEEFKNKIPEERLPALLLNALWANVFDPVNPIDANQQILLVGDLDAAVKLLRSGDIRVIEYEPDNAGSEIIADLLLIHELLTAGIVEKVNLHTKNYPFLVSDATTEDVDQTIEILSAQKPDDLRKIGGDLKELRAQGRLNVFSDPFSTSGLSFKDAPATRYSKQEHRLIIIKGDFNYRRLIDNRYLGIDANMEDAVPKEMFPVLIARTAKNQVMVRADRKLVQELEKSDKEWYRKGRGGFLQMVGLSGNDGGDKFTEITSSGGRMDTGIPQSVHSNISNVLGGIDFRALPIVSQATTNLKVDLNATVVKGLLTLNREEAWLRMINKLSTGILPTLEEIKTYIQASCAQGSIIQDRDKIILCISNVLRAEEDSCSSTDPGIKDMLVALESLRNADELKQVFLGVEYSR